MKGEFRYRVNADGTIDSICLHCFMTAAKTGNEADLDRLEAAHRCDDGERFFVLRSLTRS